MRLGACMRALMLGRAGASTAHIYARPRITPSVAQCYGWLAFSGGPRGALVICKGRIRVCVGRGGGRGGGERGGKHVRARDQLHCLPLPMHNLVPRTFHDKDALAFRRKVGF